MSSYAAYEARAAQQGHTSPPYRPTLAYRLAPLPFIVLGFLGLLMYVFPTSEQVPESKLTVVEGAPSRVEYGKHFRRYGSVETLSFFVGGYKTYISVAAGVQDFRAEKRLLALPRADQFVQRQRCG